MNRLRGVYPSRARWCTTGAVGVLIASALPRHPAPNELRDWSCGHAQGLHGAGHPDDASITCGSTCCGFGNLRRSAGQDGRCHARCHPSDDETRSDNEQPNPRAVKDIGKAVGEAVESGLG